ncbi:MAG: Mur ligase domain-containing protein [Methylococcales bacterium]|nr:Mur ligase domain-containing protein [Methylococcales bacterium]
MRMHIIGIGTTFMTGLAVLARQAGHEVSGSDSCFDLPTRRQLTDIGVVLKEGFSPANLDDKPELIIIGNELEITNAELVEARRRAIPYISGSLWLEEYILHDKWVKSLPPHYAENPLATSKKDTPHAPPKPSEKPAAVQHAPKIPPEPNSKLKRTSR